MTRTICQRCLAVITFALIPLVIGQGCSILPFWGDDDKEAFNDENTTEQILYREAQRQLRSGNYSQAISSLQRLEARFPFGRFAEQAQLELIYANYRAFEHDDARSAADRFMRLHPQHQKADYAYYIKGLAASHKNSGLVDRLSSTDISKRDMTSMREAFADFSQLLARYPNSDYAPDARQRMIYLRNVIAQSEVNIANYYMSRGAYVAAANRARYVVENYSRSDATSDALALIVEANWKLELKDAANDALRILAINYPNYSAFDENGNLVLENKIRNRDRSWTNLMTLGLLDRPDVPPPLEIHHPEGFTQPVRDATQELPEAGKKKKRWYSWLPFLG